MEPHGDNNNTRPDNTVNREEATKHALEHWRMNEKPASGTKGYRVPKVPKKPAPEKTDDAAAPAKQIPTSIPTGKGRRRDSSSTDRRDKSDRMVTIELPPFIKTALLALLCAGMLGALGFGLIKLLPMVGINIFTATSQATAPADATPDPDATALPEITPDPDATVDPNATAGPDETAVPEATAEIGDLIPVCETAQVSIYSTVYDGSETHLLKFSVPDGNIFISALNESFPVVNGQALIYVDDSEWFDAAPANDATYDVNITPVLTQLNGEVDLLEPVTYTVDVPASPLEIVQPADAYEEVMISLYTIQLRVEPGSTVTINGNDMSDFIDKRGYLSINQNVEAIGDNVVNVSVLTPSHKETRKKITLYRPILDIPLELDINTVETSTKSAVTISGTVQAGASVSVSPAPTSSEVDSTNGTFRFDLNLTRIGDNTITITATMAGKEDSVITHTIYYLPTEGEYSSKAWKMDYQGLIDFYEVWAGRIFLCNGTVTSIVPATTGTDSTLDNQFFYVNVGSDREQLIYIENYSSLNVEVGKKYKIFADVAGMEQGYPYLIARYVYEDN